LTTSGKLAVAFAANVVVLWHMIVPVPPTAGMVAPQVHPVGTVKETKVVLVGMVSVKTAFVAVGAAGPLFITVCV
jgi:hypothetical protein